MDEKTPIEFVMKETVAATKHKRKKKTAASGKRKRVQKPETRVHTKTASEAKKSEGGPESRIEEKLRAWRLAEARRRGVPAFRIFSDQTLRALATKRPATARELLAIPAMGISAVEKHGAQIYRILHEGGA